MANGHSLVRKQNSVNRSINMAFVAINIAAAGQETGGETSERKGVTVTIQLVGNEY